MVVVCGVGLVVYAANNAVTQISAVLESLCEPTGFQSGTDDEHKP
jgi:hypothetical protein